MSDGEFQPQNNVVDPLTNVISSSAMVPTSLGTLDKTIISSERKRKVTSVVWNDFSTKTINGVQYGICNHCKARLKAPSNYGTMSLHDHIKICKKRKKNGDLRQFVLQSNITKNQGTSEAQVEYRNFVFDQNVSRHELACMIIVHEYPLSMINHSRFRKFVNSSLQPFFNMVFRNTIKGDILKIYDSEKVKTSKFMEELNGRVAITSDMWTCNHSKKDFMAVTSHFIDDS
ncbi:zinc finger BED domain-containing protein RICESLEEPER 3-like [Cornus florida]|uniref:zinc finger BED domain-containing protein RICESLEEPER 3-like n=1 Tax=Cornus florida TaxID=4283 RepID=UPI0028A18F43|nr:zinc finger BED domain-containing protein RICESLEEPER 3-like [Cornus florida]